MFLLLNTRILPRIFYFHCRLLSRLRGLLVLDKMSPLVLTVCYVLILHSHNPSNGLHETLVSFKGAHKSQKQQIIFHNGFPFLKTYHMYPLSLSIYIYIYASIIFKSLSVHPSTHASIHPLTHPLSRSSMHPAIYVSIYLSNSPSVARSSRRKCNLHPTTSNACVHAYIDMYIFNTCIQIHAPARAVAFLAQDACCAHGALYRRRPCGIVSIESCGAGPFFEFVASVPRSLPIFCRSAVQGHAVP